MGRGEIFDYEHGNLKILRKHHDYNFDPHNHKKYEIFYLISGSVTYLVEGTQYALNNKDLLIFNRAELHRPQTVTNCAFDRIIIRFDSQLLSFLRGEEYDITECFLQRDMGKRNLIRKKDVGKYGIDHLLDQISYHTQKDTPERHLMVKCLLTQLIITINRAWKNTRTSYGPGVTTHNQTIDSIIRYINANLYRELSIDGLSKEFFLNKYYLCQLFKKNTGYTIKEYINSKRILKARKLLLDGCTCTQTASSVGYRCYSSFYRQFKRLTGISPKEFKKGAIY